MPHEINIGDHRVVIRLFGALQPGDVLAAYEDLLAIAPGHDRLWDYSAASLAALDADALRKIAAHAARRDGGTAPARVAVVVARDVDYGVVRAYEAWADRAPQGRGIFRDEEVAEAWLRS